MPSAPTKFDRTSMASQPSQQALNYYESVKDSESDVNVRDISRALSHCRQADREWRQLKVTDSYDLFQHVANSLVCMKLARIWKSRLVNTPSDVAKLASAVFTLMMGQDGEQKLKQVAIDTIDDYEPSLNLIDNLNRTISRLKT